MESHLEARLWNDVFNFAQDELRIPHGTIRATVLIETIPAAATSGGHKLGHPMNEAAPISAAPRTLVLNAEDNIAVALGNLDVGTLTAQGIKTIKRVPRGHKFATRAIATGAPVVTTPDLICVLDTVSGDAIGTETLRYGQRATVIALPAPPVLLTPKGLQHVGPRAFGYDLEFTSVFA